MNILVFTDVIFRELHVTSKVKIIRNIQKKEIKFFRTVGFGRKIYYYIRKIL